MVTNDTAEKRRIAAEYLSEITGEPENEMAAFLDALASGFPLPVHSIIPFYTVTTSALTNYPEGAILLFNKDFDIFLSGGEQLGDIVTETGGRRPETGSLHLKDLFNEETRDIIEPNFRSALEGEHRNILIEYRERFYSVITFPVEVKGDESIEAGVAVIRNDTKTEKNRKRMEEILEERESLVKEIHHRVKNNLSVVTGLLELQALQSRSDETREILEESQSRVQSIATLHEKLYQTSDFTNVALDSYFEDIIEHLQKTAIPDEKEITIETEIAGIKVPAKKAVSCGLILNEVVTNACKHAFEGLEGGTIKISVVDLENENLKFTISDDGSGLPENLEIGQLESLGMRLIDTLAAQIGGEYSFENRDEGGTEFMLTCNRKNDT